MVVCTKISAPLASFSTWSDVEVLRGGPCMSFEASPPITALPAGVSTRYDAWPGTWVDRMALTFTSPDVHTTCASSLGSKAMTFSPETGPAALITPLSSAARCAVSPDCSYASSIWATSLLQLKVNPSCDFESVLQITSSFGPSGEPKSQR